MLLQKLHSRGLIHPPKWLIGGAVQYLTQMGSVAYGVSGESSDVDIYGFCIPPKDVVFPHLKGEIQGFGTPSERFDQWQQHHITHPDNPNLTYDFQVFSVVKYFDLCMACNPNMIDSLFTPRRCILYTTQVGEHVRDNRKLFLHKGAWYKFRGYSYSQFHKIKAKVNANNPARAESINQHGYDTKYAYHLIRLLDECEQILVEGDLDLEKNREQLKSIRRGEWTLEQVERHFEAKERHLEEAYARSSLPHSPDQTVIKNLLLECLEMHYGSLSNVIPRNQSVAMLVRDIQDVLGKYEHTTISEDKPAIIPNDKPQ